MADLRTLLKRHSHWAVLVAVLAPLAVLLLLQYQWLVHLEKVSAVAHQANLDNYLETVTSEVSLFYESTAERALNLSPSVFLDDCTETAGWHFKQKGVQGARVLFTVNFRSGRGALPVFYDPETGRVLDLDPYGPLGQAVYVASSSWSVLGKKGIPVASTSLTIDERDPDHRIILNPITDRVENGQTRIVGLAGMVMDPVYLGLALLPEIIEDTLPAFGDAAGPDAPAPVVLVKDREGQVLFTAGSSPGEGLGPGLAAGLAAGGAQPAVTGGAGSAERPLSFLFTDWTVSLSSQGASPEQLARTNFFINLTLAALITLVLLVGILLVLRAASRAVRLSQMKSDFVSNVSHELRTPIASIRVFGELLSLGRVDQPEKVREYGSRIEAESRRLTGLIHNILDFSRIESGHKTYDFERTRLDEVVAGVLTSFEPRLRREDFEVAFEAAEDLPRVRLDVGAISQVLHNLLDNAIKYTAGDDRRIEVTLAAAPGPEPGVALSVRDRGIGIHREEQRRIFERFHRVSTGLVHDVKGSGLGLSLVEQIVHAHRGRVSVDSEPGRGSVFTIILPAAEPVPSTSTAASTAASPEARAKPAATPAPAPARRSTGTAPPLTAEG